LEGEGDIFRSIEEDVLAKITLNSSEEAELRSIIAELFDMLEPLLKRSPFHPEPILVGSCAKSTHLKFPDIDLFLMFPPDTPFEILGREGLKIGLALFPDGTEKYAQHPYICGIHREHEVEIVPCYKVESAISIRSAVDRTPFHTQYIKTHLGEDQMAQVRLLKQFCKGIQVYSADEEVQGFSGYLLELLIIAFSDFHSLLKDARDWMPGHKITLVHRLEPPGGSDPEFCDPLVVMDPVDPKRNVASPLCLRNFHLFSEASRDYLESPSTNFFFPREVEPLPVERLESLAAGPGTAFILLSFNMPDMLLTSLHSQVRKAKKNIISSMEKKGFKDLASTFAVKEGEEEVAIFLHVEPDVLPPTKVHIGPPLDHSHQERFLSKWRGHPDVVDEPFKEDGRWKVILREDHRQIESFLRSILPQINFGKDLNRTVRGKLRIESGKDAIREPWLDTLTQLLAPKRPWHL